MTVFPNRLISWYLTHQRDLPWRRTKDPYFVWLSEIMLQQTRVQQGLSYYKTFTETFPTVFDLAAASEETVLKLWQGLGYYSRARNLHASAKYIAYELDGCFPSNYKDILQLKGVGDYTASAISSICFDEVQAVVDGNVYRVLSRYFGIDTPINSTKGIKEFRALAQSLILADQPGVFNQAIMDFGSMVCKPKQPLCVSCPFNDSCDALKNASITTLPVKLKKTRVKKRYFNYLVFVSGDDKTQLHLREGKGIWQGLYEFPLLESDQSLTTDEVLAHDLFTEYAGQGASIQLFNTNEIVHKLSHQHLHTKFWIVRCAKIKGQSVPWVKVPSFPVPVLIANFLKAFNAVQIFF